MFRRPVGSPATCDVDKIGKDGTATFSQDNLPAEQGVTIGVKIGPAW